MSYQPPPPIDLPPPPAYAPPPGPAPAGLGRAEIERKVSGPATALLVTAIIGILLAVAGIAMSLLGMGMAGLGGGMEGFGGQEVPSWLVPMMSGTFQLVGNLIGIAIGCLILFAALQMKKLKNWGLAMAGSVVAMIPCLSPCCVLGLPFGIWALVVLLKPEVKASFS